MAKGVEQERDFHDHVRHTVRKTTETTNHMNNATQHSHIMSDTQMGFCFSVLLVITVVTVI